MAPLVCAGLAALLLLASHASAWTVTNYLIASSSLWIGEKTSSTQTATVSVVGTVTPSPVSSNVSTTSYLDTELGAFIGGPGTYIVTVTDLYLPLSAASLACALTPNEILSDCTTPVPTGPYTLPTPPISSRWFAPLVIQNPSSCTKTSFSYTSSTTVLPTAMPSSIYLQANNSAEAVFVTTYVVTLSTDQGGQAVTTTFADIYLGTGAVIGLKPIDQPLTSLLSQCVDPSSSLCISSVTVTDVLACQAGEKITYPPTGPSGSGAGPTGSAGGGGGSGSGGAGGGGSAQSTSKGVADGLVGRVDQQVVMGVAGMAAAYLL